MRTLKSSLALLTMMSPFSAFAQEDEPLILDEDPSAAAPAEASASASTSAGFSTTATTAAPTTTPPAAPPAAAEAPRPVVSRTIGGPDSAVGAWEMTYSGYFRAPFRVGMGSDPARGGQMTMQAPIIPDDQYSSWQFSPHNKREWAEMFFSMGNGTVSGTVAIQSFQFADSSWAYPTANFGIGQAWIELNSDLGYENLKFNTKVGSYWNRYGAAGRYDAGEYDTYLFGRTHTMGGTARLDIDMDGAVLGFEAGIGGARPNPEMFNRSRFTMLAHAHAFLNLDDIEFSAHLLHAWASAGAVPLYPNALPGSNCGYSSAPTATGGDILGVQCVPHADSFAGGVTGLNGVFGPDYPTGTQTVMGADVRADFGVGGYLYAGFSHQILNNALTVGNAIESIHSLGASNYQLGIVDNYLESPFCAAVSAPVNNSNYSTAGQFGPNGSCSNGTGTVSTVLAQYELGLANFDVFEGDQDLRFKLYGMLNYVGVGNHETQYLQPMADAANVNVEDLRQNGTVKTKFGIDAEFFALDWLSGGLRFDRLAPHSKVPEQTFMILSPRITFRSQMVTREQITIQYSRYIYAQRECMDPTGTSIMSPADDGFRSGSTIYSAGVPVPGNEYRRALCVQPPAAAGASDSFGATSTNQPVGTRGAPSITPDVNVIKIEASMWW